MGSGRLSGGGGLLGQLGSSLGINGTNNIGNAFIGALIIIIVAIIVSVVYTHRRTKSKLARAKSLSSSQKSSSLSSLPSIQSISVLADGLQHQNTRYVFSPGVL